MNGPALNLFPDKAEQADYRPTFRFGANDLGERHRAAEQSVADVPGWMRPEDALKLYELAYFTEGPILEIGTFNGKSAVLMAGALRDARRDAMVYSLDVDAACLRAASEHARSHEVADRILLVRGTARAFARAYPQLRPTLVFVDGDHSYAAVWSDLLVLERHVPTGGLVLFHDFNDLRNNDPADTEVKVRPAVAHSWVARDCDFAGVFGCCGLFVRRRGGQAVPGGAPVADLLPLESPRTQYVHRLRRPLGRAWRRVRPFR